MHQKRTNVSFYASWPFALLSPLTPQSCKSIRSSCREITWPNTGTLLKIYESVAAWQQYANCNTTSVLNRSSLTPAARPPPSLPYVMYRDENQQKSPRSFYTAEDIPFSPACNSCASKELHVVNWPPPQAPNMSFFTAFARIRITNPELEDSSTRSYVMA